MAWAPSQSKIVVHHGDQAKARFETWFLDKARASLQLEYRLGGSAGAVAITEGGGGTGDRKLVNHLGEYQRGGHAPLPLPFVPFGAGRAFKSIVLRWPSAWSA